MNLGNALGFGEPKDAFEGDGVEEVGGVGRNKDLATPIGVAGEFSGEFVEQVRVELVFGFFDTEEGVGFGVEEENEVGKHFESAVGDVAIDEGIFEGFVLEFEDESAVFGVGSFYVGNTRNSCFHAPKHLLEDIRVFLVKVLGHDREVVSNGGDVFGIECIFTPSCVADVEVRDVPVFNQRSKGTGGFEALELA